MPNKLSFNFYFKYSQNTVKRNKLKKGIISVLCAAAVAFCGMSFGFLNDVSGYFQENMQNVLDRLLVVTNPTDDTAPSYVGDFFSYCPMTAKEEDALRKIEGVEFFEPVVIFPKFSTFSMDFAIPINQDDLDQEKADKAMICHVSLSNANGLQIEKNLSTVLPEELKPGDVFSPLFDLLSYPSAEYMDQRCASVDDSVEVGGYLSSDLALMLGITPDDLNKLTVEMDVMVPVCRTDGFMLVGYDNEVEYERVKSYADFFSRKTIRFEVRGINYQIQPYGRDYIYLPAEYMLKEIDIMSAEKMDEAKEYVDLSNYHFAESQGESKIIDWAPNTYYLTVKSIQDIERIKGEIAQINPNFAVIHQYQDLEAGKEIIDNTHNVMIYISFAVLGVVLLLVSLVYVSLIDKRKFEFALLRANGLTKKEVRKVIYSEMLLQFIGIVALGIIFAVAIYLIAGVWLGYPFQFDGMTILWLFIISLGAIVLPTLISLIFVNKFEPDRIMRN